MKTIKNIIGVLVFITFISGCSKTKNEEFVIKGRMMASCSVPASNVEGFAIKQYPAAMNLGKDPISKHFSTDENGYFKIGYKRKEARGIDIRIAKSGSILEGIPAMENIDLGELMWRLHF